MSLTFLSSRDSSGSYTCRASNVHGTAETSLTVSVLFPPSCTVTYSVEGAHLLLKCSADAIPEVGFGEFLPFFDFRVQAELSWSLQDSPLEGEAGDGKEGEQTSLLRLELSDNSTGE